MEGVHVAFEVRVALGLRQVREGICFEFRPEFKLFMGTNHRPIIRDASNGMWERVRLIPFKASFPKNSSRQDPNLPAKLLAEREGILAWAVEGARRGLDKEPPVPEKVLAATNAYHSEQDTVRRFLEEECEKDPTASVTRKELLKRYTDYADEAIMPKDFAKRIRSLGILEGNVHGGERAWKGLRLKCETA